MDVALYDLLLAGPCEPARLRPAFGVPVSDVDVAEEDVADREWSALVLVTHSERHGDVSLSLSITAVDGTADRPSEATLAARVAERLGVPVVYPAESFPPSAYWLTDGHNQPARISLYSADDLDPTIEDDLALVIETVDRTHENGRAIP